MAGSSLRWGGIWQKPGTRDSVGPLARVTPEYRSAASRGRLPRGVGTNLSDALSTPMSLPLIGITACRKIIDPHPFHCAGEKYVSAVAVACEALPVLVPPLGAQLPVGTVLGRLDGLLFTGSPSNVEPHHYAGPDSRPGTLHDPHRDATTLPLLRAAIAAGVPVLCICRGFQELNVAFGGSLHQQVHELPGYLDEHHEDVTRPLDTQYAPVHEVRFAPGGLMARLAGAGQAMVNSLHGQGVDRLGAGLVVEGTAPDGLVEAVRVADAPGFTLGVQWHPEWQVMSNPLSVAMFRAFGDACRDFAARREAHEHHPAVV